MIDNQELRIPRLLTEVSCSWKPGSMDIIQVTFADYKVQCKLYTVHRLFGKQAVSDLFLSVGSAYRLWILLCKTLSLKLRTRRHCHP